MNNKITTGIWLVFAGLVFLLHNFNIIEFNFYGILQLWPLLLVSIGIGLLMQNKPFSKPVIIGANLLLCGIIFYQGMTSEKRFLDNVQFSNDNSDKAGPFTQKVNRTYDGPVETAKLTVNGGASKYAFKTAGEGSDLLLAEATQAQSSLNLESKGNEHVKMELNSKVRNNKYNNSLINVTINQKPIWDLEFNVGAAAISGDFRAIKLKNLEVNSGASSLDIHLPAPTLGESKIEVNTAASKVILYLPKGTACSVETDAIFSNNKYEDVDVVGDGYRKSKNFDSTGNKYVISVAGAANSLSILRY